MAIQNRDLGLSEQRQQLFFAHNTQLSTGASILALVVPYACAVQAVAVGARGLSGAPILDFKVLRSTSAGATIFSMGVSGLVLSAQVGASGGAQGWSGLAAGSTIANLQSGDVISVDASGANTATEKFAVCLVVQRTADIVSALGLST